MSEEHCAEHTNNCVCIAKNTTAIENLTKLAEKHDQTIETVFGRLNTVKDDMIKVKEDVGKTLNSGMIKIISTSSLVQVLAGAIILFIIQHMLKGILQSASTITAAIGG